MEKSIDGENNVSFEIQEANRVLVESIRGKIQPMPLVWPCIYKVSASLREGKEDWYMPRMVSIGPFHRDKESLQAMEEQKKWYLYAILFRRSTPGTCLEESVQALREIEEAARECYGEAIDLTSDEFVEMMLFDGCFIIELFFNYAKKVSTYGNDPLFNTAGSLGKLQHDMMLFENQLPFFVLERLFNLITRDPDKGGRSLNQLVINFFTPILPRIKIGTVPIKSSTESKHLLDLLRNHLLPSYEQMVVRDNQIKEITYRATDLWEAGVSLKKKHNADSLMEIRFSDKQRLLEIPTFIFREDTIHLLQNLIALEQYDRNCESHITSYVLFLSILIGSEKDAKLLHKNGIIECYQDYEEVLNVINKLCDGIYLTSFYYSELCLRLEIYYQNPWRKWRATLMRDYFITPGGLFLLLLTFAQTLFSILSYPPFSFSRK